MFAHAGATLPATSHYQCAWYGGLAKKIGPESTWSGGSKSIRSTPIDFLIAWEYQTCVSQGVFPGIKMENSMASKFHECEVSERINLKRRNIRGEKTTK